ncbi:hypothetical protein KOR34_40290 [Posidoniimonas corsicana]|uniref:Tetratricopeptide repeat protein n=1 Tax=Posidoniimonas corsicana TaxID=1938618 RepID=A0A5C5V3E3_9BACT|nr:hypothetical protein [Posidoniimonas corsicana]TWT32267.1 hypothetical protein KOR34_40290 [Posidoniimonas corsicana]
MAKRKGKPKRGPAARPDQGVTARRLAGGDWVLVHPREARDRAEDLEEVNVMIEAGELDIAQDELRWLLSGCSEFMAAHVLSGLVAIEQDNDIPLARGHFGFAYQLGQKALKRARCTGPLPGGQPANLPFYEAARGLAYCLEKKDKPQLADEVLAGVRGLDPTDPTDIAAMLDELRSGGAPVVDLTFPGG